MKHTDKEFGIYVHAPWCRRVCPYCAFNVYVEKKPPFKEWSSLILRDWDRLKDAYPQKAETLYFGGGTPSLVPAQVIQGLIEKLPIRQDAEITLEINPEEITKEKLQELKSAGVNRLSVGIQTFNESKARLLNRARTVKKSRDLLKLVKESNFRSWSFDLIFGLPGQSLMELNQDLDSLCSLKPPHVSLYGLTFEPGTPFHKARSSGKLKEINAELWQSQFELIIDRLTEIGMVQYEISNFSRPNHRSDHNERIWRNGHYAGLGPGAHGFLPDLRRSKQEEEWGAWKMAKGPLMELSSSWSNVTDAVLTWIRHIDGIEVQELKKFGFRILPPKIDKLRKNNFIETDGHKIKLSRKGIFMADAVTRELISGLVKI